MDASDINTSDLSSFEEIFRKYSEEHPRKPVSNTDIVIAVYDTIRHVKSGKQLNLREVVDGIRNTSERINTSKEDLPVTYFSVIKFDGRKKNENVIGHTGLIIIDIDKKDNPGIDFLQLKRDLITDKYTCVCFNSPNGGIKVVVNTNIISGGHHEAFFESIKEYFLTHYTITKIDPSGCNVARACYLPYDSDCYYKSHSYRYCLDINQINIIYSNTLNNNILHRQSTSILQVNSISLDEHYDNMMNLLKKWTNVGIYANIFNIYRYKNIEKGIMSTSVPFLEFIIAMNTYPYRLDWYTRLDEIYFKDNTQKPISTDIIEGLDGMEVCEIVLPKGYVIKEHYRAKTLGSISMKLIFNNPFCHVDYLINAVRKINFYYCEDPHPYNNPKPDDAEVRKIVTDNYRKFLDGELDFSTVIRKKSKKDKISKKYVFWSRHYQKKDRQTKHLEATRTYHDSRNTKSHKKFDNAIQVLQDGKKISQKRIAEHLGVSTRTIRRYMTDECEELIQLYNANLKLK
jgi:DNA-binding transcriptional regulator YiaG